MINCDHSTQPDKYTGWNQKQLPPKLNQFPIIFMNPNVDLISKSLTSFGYTHTYRVVYMGPRYTSNFKAYKSYCFNQTTPSIRDSIVYGNNQIPKFNFQYSHERQKFFPIRVSEYRLFTGANPTLKKDDLIFDSDFQSGNLDLAIYVNPAQYDLFMRVDSNTKGHTAWFYFKVSNITPNQKIKFNIVNYGKRYLLYKDGMAPYVYRRSKGKWTQEGISVTYKRKSFRYQETQKVLSESLSFIYDFKDSEDVYFAYCIPYSYSYLLHRLKHFKQKCPHLIKIKYGCQSSGGLPIPRITITNSSSNSQKSTILCVGRQHPGETQGSWMLDGFIEDLLSPNGHYLRQKSIIQIIPMLNVDGVVLGNFRTGIMGRDLNRCFQIKEKYNQIDLIRKMASEVSPSIFLDFHGHSSKKNVFIYGPDYKLQHRDYLTCRIFPKLISKMTPIFRYYSCQFKIAQSKITTGRAVMLKNHKIRFAYTIQASNFGYGPYNSVQAFTAKGYCEMGKYICESLSNFIKLLKIIPQRRPKNNIELNDPKMQQVDGTEKEKQISEKQQIMNNVNNIEGLSVIQKDILRQIIQDEDLLSDQQAQQKEGQPLDSDSDCQQQSNDYSATQINQIISAKFGSSTQPSNQKKKQISKDKSDLSATKPLESKKVMKQVSKSPHQEPSLPKKNFLQANKALIPGKSIKSLNKKKESSPEKLGTNKNGDREQEGKLSSFKQKSQQILAKNTKFMESIIKNKKQNPEKSAELLRLPSVSQIYEYHRSNNNNAIGWNRFLNKSTSSSNHFIFEEPSPSPLRAKSRSKARQPKATEKKKNPMFSIKKSGLPVVEKGNDTIERESPERSLLYEILQEHQKRKKLTRNPKNLKIIYS